MNSKPTHEFNLLLENLISFDLDSGNDEIYDIPGLSSSISSTLSSAPTDFVIFSQNVHKSNTSTHSILSIASTMCPPADIILIQEPSFGKIGTNPQMAQGNPIYDIYGCPKHPDWQTILPPCTSADKPPDVITYVPTRRTNWMFQLRSDLVSSPHLLCLEINSTSPPFLVFNVYNDVDNSAVALMHSLTSLLPRTLFIGDFNLHHPIWS